MAARPPDTLHPNQFAKKGRIDCMKNFKTLSKRGLALFLALMMCVSLLPATALAAEMAETTHTHNEDGWTCVETRELTCAYGEHTHDKTCWETSETAICGLEESEEHTHDAGCYIIPACGMEEHTHDSGCYVPDWDCVEPSEAVKLFLRIVKDIPVEITVEDEALISEARSAYDALTVEEQAIVSVTEALGILVNAEVAQEAAKAARDEAAAAAEVIQPFVDAVANIPEISMITLENFEEVSSYIQDVCYILYEELLVTEYAGLDKFVAAEADFLAVVARIEELAGLQSETLESDPIILTVGVTTTVRGTSTTSYWHSWKITEGSECVAINSSNSSSVQVTGRSAGEATIEHSYYKGNKKTESFTIIVSGGAVITYKASTGGSVSLASETLEEGKDVQGSTATPSSGYIFRNWTDSAGNVVSTAAKFVPDSIATATYTANFVKADAQDAYYYILKPGKDWDTAGDSSNYRDAWYYVGKGTVSGTTASDSGFAQVGSVPNDYPSIEVTEDGETHTYTYDATGSGRDYTYTVEWVRVVSSFGANNGNTSIIDKTCWHVDGIAKLRTPDRATVTFKFQDYNNQGGFALDQVGNADAVYRVKVGETVPANKVPSHESTKVVGGVTYTFEGWYTNEACTGAKITDPSSHPITEDVTFYGKYTARYTVTYDLAGGTSSTAQLSYFNLKADTSTPRIATPTKEGYLFIGWDPEVANTVTENANYVAQWEPNSYTVSYSVSGDVPAGYTVPEDATVVHGSRYAVADVPQGQAGEKDGVPGTYSFVGWKDGDEIVTELTNVTENKTLTGVWTFMADSYAYTVNYYLENTTTKVAESKTVEDQTFGAEVTENAIAVPNYVVEGVRTQTITIGVENNVINFYYTADRIGPNGGPDGTPDKYQATVTFTVVNGTWTGGGTTRSTVVTLRNAAGEMAADGTYTLRTGDIPTGTANAGYANGVWGANANPNGAVIDRRGASYELTYAPAGTTGPVFPPPDPGPGTDGGTTTIPENPTPLGPDPDGATTILDEEVPLANAVGLNITEHFAYIIGYEDDTVRPLKNITRAEAVTIFFRLMEDDYRAANWSMENPFSDVNAGNWHNNAVSTCLKAGALKRFAQDAAFLPNQAITRAEFASIAAGFVSGEITGESIGDFSDTEGHWAAADIRKAVEAGWIKGVGGNRFAPDETITRAEVMTIVNRMLDRVPDAEHMLPDMKKWLDNPEDAWYYEAVQEATNEHDYDVDEFGAESWTEILEARDWKSLENEWANNGGMSASAEPVKPEEGAEGEGEAEDAGSESEEA